MQKEWASTDCIDSCLDKFKFCNGLLTADHCNDLLCPNESLLMCELNENQLCETLCIGHL